MSAEFNLDATQGDDVRIIERAFYSAILLCNMRLISELPETANIDAALYTMDTAEVDMADMPPSKQARSVRVTLILDLC